MTRQADVSPLLKPFSPSNDFIDPIKKLIGHDFNVGLTENTGRRPRDNPILHGPDFAHHRRDVRGERPSLDDPFGQCGTHDVNDEMLAKEYGGGLRVRFGNRSRCDSLGFLFGK